MDEFTKEDPGRGHPEAIDELTGRLRQDQGKLEYAHAAVRKSTFAYSYEVTRINADGTAEVTIKATNKTTADSATRIPGSGRWPGGPYHVPPYDKMKHLEETTGQYEPIEQEITWTATVRMP